MFYFHALLFQRVTIPQVQNSKFFTSHYCIPSFTTRPSALKCPILLVSEPYHLFPNILFEKSASVLISKKKMIESITHKSEDHKHLRHLIA